MGIDTRIDGTPDAVHGIADWVAHAVSPRIEECADALYASRNNANAGWDGPASDVFVDRTSIAATDVDAFAAAVDSCASRLRGAAEALALAHTSMAAARTTAAAAGLLVMQDSIAPPILDEQRPAYRAAEDAVAVAREHERNYAEQLKEVVDGLTAKWFFVGASMIASGVFAASKLHANILSAQSADLAARGTALKDAAMAAGPETPARLIYRDWDLGSQMTARAAALDAVVDDLRGQTRFTSVKIGGILALGEVMYDIYSGTPPVQAAASALAGFGGSVIAGSAVGTLVGGPVGTAVGAGVGVVAGIYAAGVTDGYFEDGFSSLGDTFSDGVDGVEDTVKAVADLTTGAWRAAF